MDASNAWSENSTGKRGSVAESRKAKKVDEQQLTLEERLARLDEIVAALETGDVELDRGLELFEEGVRHIRQAEQALARAELRVEELVGEGTNLRSQPLDAEVERE